MSTTRAYDVQYTQGSVSKWRLVYAKDTDDAKLSVIRSTWDKVVISDVRPITDRLRSSSADWNAV